MCERNMANPNKCHNIKAIGYGAYARGLCGGIMKAALHAGQEAQNITVT